MDNKFSFDEFMKKAKEEFNTDRAFNEILLDAAIEGAETDDKRLAFMIARKCNDIMNVVVENFAQAEAVLPMSFENKKNAYRYLCAVEKSLKAFGEQLKETDKS